VSVREHRSEKDFSNPPEPGDGTVMRTRDAQLVITAFPAIRDIGGWFPSHQNVKTNFATKIFQTHEIVALLFVVLANPALALRLNLNAKAKMRVTK